MIENASPLDLGFLSSDLEDIKTSKQKQKMRSSSHFTPKISLWSSTAASSIPSKAPFTSSLDETQPAASVEGKVSWSKILYSIPQDGKPVIINIRPKDKDGGKVKMSLWIEYFKETKDKNGNRHLKLGPVFG
jgi:hypothetical protein